MIANRKPEMPSSLVSEIEALMKKSGESRRAGHGTASLELSEEAWSIIPDPKTEWNFYPQTISRGVVETIKERGACRVLDKWLDRMYLTHFDPEHIDPYTNMVAGHALFRCNRREDAVAAFKRVLKYGGPGHFSGEYRPYLDLAEKG